MKIRRKPCPPSSGHYLILLAAPFRDASMMPTLLERNRARIANLAGIAGADWAIRELQTLPVFPDRVKSGWPKPCKAGRMSMPKAVR